jgi:rare lipoprotein A
MTAGIWARRVAFLAAALAVAGCASRTPAVTRPPAAVAPPTAPAAESGLYKVGNPYQVDGVWYYPAENYAYREEGIASWYGDDFHGKRTANGERFDMNAVSAAHPTLPMPSSVKVTNLDNGRELNVRVNDRGPFKSRRVIDLSRRAAQLLGFDTAGTARVRVEINAEESLTMKNQALRSSPGELPKVAAAPVAAVTAAPLAPPVMSDASPSPGGRPVPAPKVVAAALPAPKPVSAPPAKTAKGAKAAGAPVAMNGHAAAPALPPAAAGPGIYVQAGAFSDLSNAHRLEQELKEFGNSFVLPVTINNRQLYRVRLGPLGDTEIAEGLLGRVRSYGYDDAQIVRY